MPLDRPFFTKTFQCVVLLQKRESLCSKLKPVHTNRWLFVIEYEAGKFSHSLDLFQKGHHQVLRFCQSGLHVLRKRVETFHSNTIKIHVRDLNSSDTPSTKCRFAGFAMYQLTKDKHEELTTVCESKIYQHQYRDMYSESSKIILVFYSFNAPHFLNISVNISQSHCSSTIINVCKNRVGDFFSAHFISDSYQKGYKKVRLEDTPHSCVVLQLQVPDKLLQTHLTYYRSYYRSEITTSKPVVVQQVVTGFFKSYQPHGIGHETGKTSTNLTLIPVEDNTDTTQLLHIPLQ